MFVCGQMYGAVVVFYETVGSHPCLKEMSKALNVHEEVCRRRRRINSLGLGGKERQCECSLLAQLRVRAQ